MIIRRKYATAGIIDGIPLVEYGSPDFTVNPTLAAGDVKISQDGGAFADIEGGGTFSDFIAVTPSGSTSVRISLTSGNLTCKRLVIKFVDQTGSKEWKDQEVIVETFGHASAQEQWDLTDGVRLGLTALPNTACATNASLITSGTGTAQLSVSGGAVTVGTINSAVITAASIASDAITAAKIADGAIDRATFAADTGLLSVRSSTATGGAAGTITLDASASATTDFYVGMYIRVTGGTGIGQVRLCTAYNGTTKVATITPNWAVTPVNGDTFAILESGAADLKAILGVAVSTTTAQLGVNIVNAGGTAWASGSLTSGVFAAGAINAAAIAADAITDAKVAADVTIASVTGAVGSVTGNVGGNVTGSVGSVTGNVGGNVTGSVGSVASGGISRASFTADTGLQPARSNTAQTGSTSSTIKLDASASAVTDFYKNAWVYLTGGTGVGQTRLVTAYNGTTKVATISPDWATTPDNTSTFAILPTATSATTISGTVDANVVSMAANTLTASAIAADAITAAKIADGAIDAATFAAGAINAAAIAADAITDAKVAADVTIASVTGAVGSVTGAVGSVTGNVGGNVTGSVGSVASGGITRASLAADTGLQPARSNTAQAGSTASTVILDASASAVTDFYKDAWVYLTGGTGAGQARLITAYDGTTKTATISPNWKTTPDNTSTFAVLAVATVGSTVSGTVDANVVSMAADTITASAIAADAITAAKIANGAIDANTFAAGAINAAAIAADAITDAKVAADVTIASVTGAVGSVTGNVGGNVTGSVGSVASGGITRASFASDTGLQTIRSNTARGGAAGTITLDLGASSVADFYVDTWIYVVSGTGAGQVRLCTAYNETTKVASVTPNWGTTPVNGDAFVILATGQAAASATVSGTVDANMVSVDGSSTAAQRMALWHDGVTVNAVDDPSPNPGSFTGGAGLSGSNDIYNDMIMQFVTGVNAGRNRRISDYVGVSKTFSFNGTSGQDDRAWDAAPSDTDQFFILGRIRS